MPDLTVVYYSSNREDPKFEERVIKRLLLSAGDAPIVSVSHKPMALGENICVGDVGLSNLNVFRQLQIGAIAAKTKFIATAESDCLYPEEYFLFRPPVEGRAFKPSNLFMLFMKGGFYRKAYSECATVVGRDYLIRRIDKVLAGREKWRPTMEERGDQYTYTPFKRGRFAFFDCNNAVINIKTKNNMHKKTWVSDKIPIDELPYWGTADKIREEMFK